VPDMPHEPVQIQQMTAGINMPLAAS
jgi:hypothetical protein